MLNSILERKPQKITIDRLLITPDEENPQLITNQEDIERITIDHYQNVASSNNLALFTSYDNLTPFWQHIYKEKHKSPEHQSILTTTITLDELTTTIQSLPNNKAPGPTGITYEFWKHFPKPHYKLLLTFFNNILNTGFIPSAWKEALLYPIPKPEFWNYQLDKTRPIILLETLRKIFVKIITDRLNKFLSSTNALQPNNQAGIAGSSTAKIILTIQTCIDIQITQNQKFYIIVQDLSKAYDRINLDLLILAMKRLDIPQIFQLTIINLFKGHKNSVIIGNHLTNSFDLLNGVIQGEVISPILWVLYYDPLFEAINQTTHGRINLQANHPMNIYDHQNDTSTHFLQKNCKLLGYLDDTTWLNSSISHLEEHLNIADEFYNFSNIKINKTKCHLLTNDQDCINKGSVEINFGPTRINVDIIGKTDNLRILEAYFNAFNNHNKLYKKLLTTTNHLIHMIKKKKLQKI
ncbi:RNA-directed DNA polymerase from mobile element jockey-like [Rhizophagus clarus]|uniref:RNA-directed DNA polymerase from mobile element jockey-like n=1 Tax=Rhizophagus clarus TaxID=94130 RepID=A0A8H3QDP7_9GLOM|nr:RNA-directed DNA polymerase from mobile element jockey-like [Rhizophagus clarus]